MSTDNQAGPYQTVLGQLGVFRDRLDGKFIEIDGVTFYSVDAGADFDHPNLAPEYQSPVYEVQYVENNGGWDMTESLYDLNSDSLAGVPGRWLAIVSQSDKIGEKGDFVVLVAPYSDDSFRTIVRHMMRRVITIPDACDRLQGLLQEVIDREIDERHKQPWCANCRKAL